MTLTDTLQSGMVVLRDSGIVRGTMDLGIGMVLLVSILLVLVSITFLLRKFFRNHEVNRIHRVLIYLLTMAGVIALIIAGILGIMLPLIPGIPFLLAAFLLMRKYHKWNWLEKQIKRLKSKLHPSGKA